MRFPSQVKRMCYTKDHKNRKGGDFWKDELLDFRIYPGRDRIHFSDVSLAIRRFPKTLIREKPDLSFCFLFHSFRFTDQHACSEPGTLSYLRRTHCIFPFYGIFIASILKEKGFACVYPGSSENFLPESWAGNLSLQLWPMTVNIFSSHFSAD